MRLQDTLAHKPVELSFGTSGLRGLVQDMTDLECYINAKGFLDFVRRATPATKMIYLAGDLRDSTPRIMQVVAQAIIDSGLDYVNCGLIPTPAVAYFAQQQSAPCIMVTGSHIPADRNGIKFYKTDGEVLKEDEVPIKQAVAKVRQAEYDSETGTFDVHGSLIEMLPLKASTTAARDLYRARYTDYFTGEPLAGKKIVMYQHSAVGRDIIPDILEALGAIVVKVGKSDVFIPIDTENVTDKEAAYFKSLAEQYPEAFAIVSTDGDSDRPFVIDETGIFHRGDILGLPTTELLGVKGAATPISANDAVADYLQERSVRYKTTQIGSPYVITAMRQLSKDVHPVGSWEVNGGYLLGSDISKTDGRVLKALPTRDALLPIICALLQAIAKQQSVSALFAGYPKRYTQAGLIDNFPQTASQAILKSVASKSMAQKVMDEVLDQSETFGVVANVNNTDGVRVKFENGDVMHIRPSGNAPQLRVYSNADSQVRADEIVARCVSEPDGILRRLQTRI